VVAKMGEDVLVVHAALEELKEISETTIGETTEEERTRNDEKEGTRITGEKKTVGIVTTSVNVIATSEGLTRLGQGKTTLPPATQQFATPLLLLKTNKPSPLIQFHLLILKPKLNK